MCKSDVSRVTVSQIVNYAAAGTYSKDIAAPAGYRPVSAFLYTEEFPPADVTTHYIAPWNGNTAFRYKFTTNAASRYVVLVAIFERRDAEDDVSYSLPTEDL